MIKSNQVDQKVLKVTTKEKLRSLSDHTGVFSDKFYLEDLKEEFYYDPTDTTSADNGVDVFINIATNRRYKLWKSPTVTAEINNISNVEIPVAVSDRLPYKSINEVKTSNIPFSEIYITDTYKHGVFKLDPSDTTTANDDALVIVDNTGKRFKRQFNGQVDVRWFGVIADGVTDNRTTLQAALNNTVCRNFLIPKTAQPYRISNSVQIPSNTKIFMEPGVDIFGMGTNTNHTFRMDNAHDVVIEGWGATIRDIYESYPETAEFYGSIALRSCERITILGLIIKDTGGDGIYVGVARGTACQEIIIKGCDISRVSRNGISLVSCDGVFVEDCKIHNINRMFPRAGIDIEPDTATHKASNIHINNLKTSGCTGGGITIALGASVLDGLKDISININNHVDKGSRYGLYTTRYSTNLKGSININKPTWINNLSVAYLNNGTNPEGIDINIYDPTVINPHFTNTIAENGMWTAFLFYRPPGVTSPLNSFGGVNIYRPYILDTVVPDGGVARAAINGFVFRDADGKPWTNVVIDSPKLISVPNDKIKIYHADGGLKVRDDFNVLNKSFTSSGEHFLIVNLQTGGNNNFVKTVTNRNATGDNTVEFSAGNPDLYEFEIAVESANRITLILPPSPAHTCPEMQQGTTTGFYSNVVGSRLKLMYHRDEKRFSVISVQGKWYSRNKNTLCIDTGALNVEDNVTLPAGINSAQKNTVIVVKDVPNAVTDLNITNQVSNKNQYLLIKRDANTNGNVVRIYVNDAIGGGIGSINGSGRTMHCLSQKNEAILLWCDGTDYKVINWYRPTMTTVTTAGTGPTRSELNTQYGYEKEGFAVYNTVLKKTYTKLTIANNSPWISTDWVTGVITQMP